MPEDGPLGDRDVVGDAVDDHVVERGAQRRRISPVVEECRHAAGRADQLLGVAVELPGGDPGRDHRLELVEHAVNDARSPASISSISPGGLEDRHLARLDRVQDRPPHLVHRTVAVDLAQQPAAPVVVDQRLGLLAVDPQPLADHLFLVVGAALPQDRAPHQLLFRHVDEHHVVERLVAGLEDPAQGLGLGGRARIAVEQEAALGVRLRRAARVTTSAIRSSPTSSPDVHDRARTRAPSSLPFATASRSMSPVEMAGIPSSRASAVGLGSLAGSGRPEEHDARGLRHPRRPRILPRFMNPS